MDNAKTSRAYFFTLQNFDCIFYVIQRLIRWNYLQLTGCDHKAVNSHLVNNNRIPDLFLFKQRYVRGMKSIQTPLSTGKKKELLLDLKLLIFFLWAESPFPYSKITISSGEIKSVPSFNFSLTVCISLFISSKSLLSRDKAWYISTFKSIQTNNCESYVYTSYYYTQQVFITLCHEICRQSE